MVAVSPAVDRTLNETSLSPETRVELSQSPADRVAFAFVVQPVAFVLILWAASSRIDAVLGLEVLRELIDVDRLDIAADRVLHLDSISRILESNPLNTILILTNHKRGGGWDGSRSSIGVDCSTSRRAVMKVRRSSSRCGGSSSGRAHSSALSLDLALRKLIPRAVCKGLGDWMRCGVLLEWLAWLLLDEVGADGTGLLNWMLSIWELLGLIRRVGGVHRRLIHRPAVVFLMRRLHRGWGGRLLGRIHWWVCCTIHGCSRHTVWINVFRCGVASRDVVAAVRSRIREVRSFRRRLSTGSREAGHVRRRRQGVRNLWRCVWALGLVRRPLRMVMR